MKSNGKNLSTLDYVIILGYIIAIILVYTLLHGVYRPYNTDDGIFLSFVYNHIVRGIEIDTVLGGAVGAGGYGGVLLFGKTFSYLYGLILNLMGWTKGNAILISSAWLSLASLVWYRIMRKLGHGTRLAVFFALSLLLIEPFFGAANQLRSEALSFFLVSAALLLFLNKTYTAAALLAVISFEIHPFAGIAAFFYFIPAFILHLQEFGFNIRNIAKIVLPFGLGLVLGGAYYCLLHYQALGSFFLSLFSGYTGGGNLLHSYFFETKFYRHVPELILILVSAAHFIRKKYYQDDLFVPLFLLASLAITIVVKRPNFHYTVFIYPSFLLLVLFVFKRIRRLRLFMVLILLYLLPQYSFVFLMNRGFDLNGYLEKAQAAVPRDGDPVVGHPNNWFAFKDREFHVPFYTNGIESLGLKRFYVIEDDAYRQGKYPELTKTIAEDYSTKEIRRFDHQAITYIVKRITKK